MNTFHVVPNNGGWGVKREGDALATSTHATQKEAIDAARILAQDGDDIVIHRADGTIREKKTYYTGPQTNTNKEPARPETHDVVPVGSRVSWAAVLAGLAVALTVYVCLTLLAVAIGVSTVDYIQSRTFAITAGIIGIVTLLAAMFLGGYATSRLTTRETLDEAVIYGVVLWAAFFVLVTLVGVNLGSSYALTTQVGRAPSVSAALDRPAVESLSPEAERRRKEMTERGERLLAEVDPAALAWWAFAGTVLSVLAAVGGSVAGAGPEVVFKRFRRQPGTPQPVVAQRA